MTGTPPPPTRREEVVDSYHPGTPFEAEVADPYRWLEAGDDPEVTAWVSAQNARSREVLDARPDRSEWRDRVLNLLRAPVVAAVKAAGDHVFVLERPQGGEQLELALRSAHDPSVEPRTLVRTPSATTAIDWFEPSRDGSLLVFGLSENGTEDSVLHVLDVASGTVLDERIPHTRAASIAWDVDGKGFCYTRYPPDDEYHRLVYHHRLGDAWEDDDLVWAELPTPESWPEIRASDDGRYLLVEVMVGWGHIEAHLLDRTTGTWTPVITGHEVVSAFAFAGEHLVGMTTLEASRGRLIITRLDRPGVEHWRTLVPERDAVLGRPEVMGDELLVVATLRAVDRVERYALDGASRGAMDGLGTVAVAGLEAAGSDAAFVITTGFTRPTSLWRWTPADGLTRWAGAATVDGLPELTVRQVRYLSLDGTEVGMFLIHAAHVDPGPDTAAILNGYGGFAITETPIWSPLVGAWCAQGGLYAIAGLRGGLEEGEAWHHAGRRDQKQNVFDDFHAAADWLVDQGLTARDQLGIAGGSNGGLLVATALTQRPDAYRAVWCAVPLCDMVRFPQFLIARLWTDEYGDPDVAEEFGWLWAYSPYHHVRRDRAYPAVLVTTAEGDTRVDPLHARKMAAALQWATEGQAGRDGRPILLLQEGKAGHGVGKPVGKRADEAADVLSFMAWQLGLEGPPG